MNIDLDTSTLSTLHNMNFSGENKIISNTARRPTVSFHFYLCVVPSLSFIPFSIA